MTMDRGPATWWAALEAHGLDHLSAPELAHALQELAHDRPAFLGVLAAANDYPRVGLCSLRRPDRAEIARLDSQLPRARAILLPEDEVGIRTALVAFEVLLVLDPLWNTGDLFYASWHASQGISPEHAQRLHRKLAPAVRLSSAREALRFIPDHIPGGWDPFPFGSSAPLRRAAGLLYWANCLRGVAVAGLSDVAVALRELARAGPDLQGGGGAEVLVSPAAGSSHQAWGEIFDALADDPTPLVPLLGPAGYVAAWRLGVGAPALPDVSLAMLRAQAGRPLCSGFPGTPFLLARRPVYLVPA
jgi:hypothetical protein